MRIGIDAHSLEGLRSGARGRYLLNLLREWSRMDTGDNQFILYFQNEIPKFEFLDSSKFEKKTLKALAPRQSFTLYYNFILPFEAQKDKTDVMFFPLYMLPFMYRPRNAVVTIHDVYFEANPGAYPMRHRIPLRLLSKNAARNAFRIITISDFSKQEIVKYYNADPKKIIPIPLAPDPIFNEPKNLDNIGEIKKKYGIGKSYMLSVGSIFQRRYVDKTIEAFSKTARNNPDWELFVVGRNLTSPFIDIDGMIESANNKLAREVIKRIDYAEDEELVYLVQGASIGIYLSSYEGFGLPPLEFMAAGVSVITTNLTALKETVDEAGLIIQDPKDTREITKALERLMEDSGERAKYAQKGLKWSKKFSWEKTAKETLEVLKIMK